MNRNNKLLTNDFGNFVNKVSSKIYYKERLKKRNDIVVFFENKADLRKSVNYFYTILGLKNNRSYSRFAVAVKKSKLNSVNTDMHGMLMEEKS